MNKSVFVCALSLCINFSCNAQVTSPATTEIDHNLVITEFNADSLLASVKYLSSDKMEGRKTGEAGGIMARAYIVSKFKALNVLPFNGSYEQPFAALEKEKELDAVNVIGLVKGTEYPEKYIVVSGHYDHVGIINGKIYNGADDNAAGIGSLFALAEFLAKNPPKHSVLLTAFDAEEIGLQGAKYFVKQAKNNNTNVVFNINMDMISRSETNEIYAVGQLSQKEVQPIIASIQLPENFSIAKGHEGNDGKSNWLYASDHAPFLEAGIPIIYFGVEDHEDYHKPTDDFERIDQDFYFKAVGVIIKTLVAIDQHYH